jgi:hypothetical protein
VAFLRSAGRIPKHCAWLIERTEPYLDRATEAQLIAIGSVALVLGVIPLAWRATAHGLAMGGSNLQRALLLRAEILLRIKADPKRTLLAIEAARTLAQRAHDAGLVSRAAELAHEIHFHRMREETLSPHEIDAIVNQERASAVPILRGQSPKKTRRKKAQPKKKPAPNQEKGLFEP